MKKIILLIFGSVLIVSCGKGTNQIATTASNPSSTYEQRIPGSDSSIKILTSRSGLAWQPFYTNKISQILEGGIYGHIIDIDLDKSNLSELGCPKYNTASKIEKTTFWIAYLATISNIESGYASNFWIWDRWHKKSSGLFMVSAEDVDEYLSPTTGINYSITKLLDPSLNIESAIGLLYLQLTGQLHNQTTNNKLFYFDSKASWVTIGLSLRTDKAEFVRTFSFYSSQFPWCR
jgi:hypothetical protein